MNEHRDDPRYADYRSPAELAADEKRSHPAVERARVLRKIARQSEWIDAPDSEDYKE